LHSSISDYNRRRTGKDVVNGSLTCTAQNAVRGKCRETDERLSTDIETDERLSTDIETDERIKTDFGHAGGGAGEGWASAGCQRILKRMNG